MKLLARLLIGFGLLCYAIGMYYIWLQNDPNRLAFTDYKYEKSVSSDKKELPTRITINALKINLPLIPAQQKNKSWDVTNDGASYLTSSPIPGEKGNSIIYAHNWASLFGKLPEAKKGDEIEVTFADKSKKQFVIQSIATVSPDDSTLLKQTDDKRLTLYTCIGFLDSKRFVVIAKPKDS